MSALQLAVTIALTVAFFLGALVSGFWAVMTQDPSHEITHHMFNWISLNLGLIGAFAGCLCARRFRRNGIFDWFFAAFLAAYIVLSLSVVLVPLIAKTPTASMDPWFEFLNWYQAFLSFPLTFFFVAKP